MDEEVVTLEQALEEKDVGLEEVPTVEGGTGGVACSGLLPDGVSCPGPLLEFLRGIQGQGRTRGTHQSHPVQMVGGGWDGPGQWK